MALAHLSVRVHSRSRGHTAAAAVAYRIGDALDCPETGQVVDFRHRKRRQAIAGHGIASAIDTPIAASYQAWVDGVEAAERRVNSCIARDVEVSLPHELAEEDRERLAVEFAQWLSSRYRTPTVWAIHRPDPGGDQRNHHVHVLLPTRALAEDGQSFGEKLRVLDDRSRAPDKSPSRGVREIVAIRAEWERRCNTALAAAGVEEEIDMGPSPDGPRQVHVGATATSIERAHPDAPAGRPIAEVVAITGGVTDRGRQLVAAVAAAEERDARAAIAALEGGHPDAEARPLAEVVAITGATDRVQQLAADLAEDRAEIAALEAELRGARLVRAWARAAPDVAARVARLQAVRPPPPAEPVTAIAAVRDGLSRWRHPRPGRPPAAEPVGIVAAVRAAIAGWTRPSPGRPPAAEPVGIVAAVRAAIAGWRRPRPGRAPLAVPSAAAAAVLVDLTAVRARRLDEVPTRAPPRRTSRAELYEEVYAGVARRRRLPPVPPPADPERISRLRDAYGPLVRRPAPERPAAGPPDNRGDRPPSRGPSPPKKPGDPSGGPGSA